MPDLPENLFADGSYTQDYKQTETIADEKMEDAKEAMQASLTDDNRINAATNLLNTFNFAVQEQAGRNKWLPSDYKAFAIALVALDNIGKT